MKLFYSGLCAILLSGCTMPLAGGRASVQVPNGVSAAVEQPQNPKDEAVQTWEREQKSDGSVSEKVTTKIGAAQKDTAREIGAKLASLKWVTWVGVAVFLFGIASAFWPPLKLIVGSVTTSAVACVAGLALIVLPVLVVGHELLILGGGVGAVFLYWFSHRHGKLQGLVDANKNGIDDRREKNEL
jgi:hypothetical protein